MTRPRSNRLGMYADVRSVLDSALQHGGGEYECTSHGAAVHWRQRAYQFRKLYAETLGLTRESPYDVLMMRQIGDDSSTVRIELRSQPGVFRPTNPDAVMPGLDDELFDVAGALAEKIEKGEL